MKPIIVHQRIDPGTCRSCGARVEWATVAATGRRMPFDPPVTVLSRLDEYVEVDMDRTRSHFATCPDAEAWRRKRARGNTA